jgi:hypothetical protein
MSLNLSRKLFSKKMVTPEVLEEACVLVDDEGAGDATVFFPPGLKLAPGLPATGETSLTAAGAGGKGKGVIAGAGAGLTTAGGSGRGVLAAAPIMLILRGRSWLKGEGGGTVGRWGELGEEVLRCGAVVPSL